MTDLLKLAERCEQAMGPDRELDERIGMGIGLKRTIRVGHECLGNDREVPVNCPHFTASLDAAMSLVPETCLAMVKQLWDGEQKAALARVSRYGKGMWTGDWSGLSWHPALALCAAALRARASMEKNNG